MRAGPRRRARGPAGAPPERRRLSSRSPAHAQRLEQMARRARSSRLAAMCARSRARPVRASLPDGRPLDLAPVDDGSEADRARDRCVVDRPGGMYERQRVPTGCRSALVEHCRVQTLPRLGGESRFERAGVQAAQRPRGVARHGRRSQPRAAIELSSAAVVRRDSGERWNGSCRSKGISRSLYDFHLSIPYDPSATTRPTRGPIWQKAATAGPLVPIALGSPWLDTAQRRHASSTAGRRARGSA